MVVSRTSTDVIRRPIGTKRTHINGLLQWFGTSTKQLLISAIVTMLKRLSICICTAEKGVLNRLSQTGAIVHSTDLEM